MDEFGKHVELNDNLYPLSLCKDAVASPWTTKTYCVDYDYEKIKIGKNYNTNQQTWFRLALHLCDAEARAKEGKYCESRQESMEYFNKYIVSIQMK